MRDFKELAVWKQAHFLALAVYRATAAFPAAECRGLVRELRRTAVLVPAKIANGCGRQSARELRRLLRLARRLARRLECLLLLSHDLGFLDDDVWSQLDAQTRETIRMLKASCSR